MIKVERVYDHKSGHGKRYLVDRLWPRGVKKEDLKISGWLKEVAPSNELRQWFHHDPEKWDEFRKRYIQELKEHPESWQELKDAVQKGNVTLLYSAKDEAHNNAVVLKEFLESKEK